MPGKVWYKFQIALKYNAITLLLRKELEMLIKKSTVWVVVLSIHVLVFAGFGNAQSLPGSAVVNEEQAGVIPKEPGWSDPSYRGWELMGIPGLISTYYDLDADGELDYMVIRKLMRKTSAEDITMEQAIEIAKYDELTVYFSHPVIYFAHRHPLFYCLGVDLRRNCRDIWVDVAEDGLNGNEELYTLSTPRLGVR